MGEKPSVKVYTIREVAMLLKLHYHTVNNLIKKGELEAIKIGNQYRITEEALQEYLKTHTIPK